MPDEIDQAIAEYLNESKPTAAELRRKPLHTLTKEERVIVAKDIMKECRPYKPIRSFIAKTAEDMFIDPAKKGVKTGLTEIDSMGGCFRRQEFIVIAARPSMGKTAFVVTIMINMAKAGNPILLFSLEMSKEGIGGRMLCQQARVCMDDINNGTGNDTNMPKIMRAAQPLSELPIWIDETGGLTIEDMEERILTAIEEHGIKCVFIDYLQLMNSKMKNPESRHTYIGHISRNIKRIAKANDIPMVVLGQVNRRCEERVNKRPTSSDLKDSGDIEQDADVVILLYRDEKYNPATDDKGIAEAIFDKNRNGRTGVVKLAFLEESMRFADLSDRWDL
jgi:replicative DNA helicase